MAKAVLGIIGGSGIYDLPGLEDMREEPSRARGASRRTCCASGGSAATEIVFLPRHGRGHRLLALRHQLPRQYRRAEAGGRDRHRLALGLRLVQRRICRPASSCSSTSSSTARTGARARSSAAGCVAHVSMAHPVGPARCRSASRRRRRPRASPYRRGGTYVCMEGPQFSSYAEVDDLQGPGLRRDRHDRDARGQARPGGRDHLCHPRHGDGLTIAGTRPRRTWT